ncbi:hypothetical protein [Microscilla marina]|uniref:hypothetical protein n=1 Tax=Microscilla marina TaxID=1027 RepID=UPI000948DE59
MTEETVIALRTLLKTYLTERLVRYESRELQTGLRDKFRSYTRDASTKYPQFNHSIVFVAGLVQMKITDVTKVKLICQDLGLNSTTTEEIAHNVGAFQSNKITSVKEYESWKRKIVEFRKKARLNQIIVKVEVPGDPYPLYRIAKGWEVYGINPDGTHVKFNRQGYIKRIYVDKYLTNDSKKLTGLYIRRPNDPIDTYSEIILLNTLTYDELSPAEKEHPVSALVQERENVWWNKSFVVRTVKGKVGAFVYGLTVPTTAAFYMYSKKAEWINFLMRETTWDWVEKVIDAINKL